MSRGPGRLLRTIRLDRSDGVIFRRPAEPGEWAVAGGFLWAGRDPATLDRKARIAFRSGFLGIASFGFSTLAVVSEASAAERAAAETALAERLVEHLGAPDRATALPAAAEELAYSATLCAGHAIGTLIALHRSADADGGVREQFRTLRPREATSLAGAHLRGHERAFSLVAIDGPDEGADAPAAAAPVEAGERVDLVALLKARR